MVAEHTETGLFKCLRCGLAYESAYTPRKVEERACPKCGSNSQRRLKGAAGPG